MRRDNYNYKFYKLLTALILLVCSIFISGCNLLAFPMYAMNANKTKKVLPEYAGLAGKRICIWVWADESLMFDYPAIRLDIATHVKYFIQQHIKCDIVDPIEVDKYRKSNYQVDILSPVEIGKHFKADLVLFIEVNDFGTQMPDSPELLQGHLSAHCVLYDCKGTMPITSPSRKLWSGNINIVYPKDRPVSAAQMNALAMRSIILKLFGEQLAKKFYEHREPVDR